MPTRLASTFSAARAQGRRLLCPFLTAGYPSLDATPHLMLAAQQGGAGILELGIPFSDPVADGPVIQASFTHALAHGTTVAKALATVAEARRLGLSIPVLAMVSFSIIFKKGTREFASLCAQSGVDGVILPDIPLEEAPDVVAAFSAQGLQSVLLIAPSTAPDRRAAITKLCTGFVYYLSVAGITGERKQLPPDIAANLQALRQLTQVPICVGFGVSTPEHVRQVVAHADGAIVGSALIRHITEHLSAPTPALAAEVEAFIRHLATGLPRA